MQSVYGTKSLYLSLARLVQRLTHRWLCHTRLFAMATSGIHQKKVFRCAHWEISRTWLNTVLSGVVSHLLHCLRQESKIPSHLSTTLMLSSSTKRRAQLQLEFVTLFSKYKNSLVWKSTPTSTNVSKSQGTYLTNSLTIQFVTCLVCSPQTH